MKKANDPTLCFDVPDHTSSFAATILDAEVASVPCPTLSSHGFRRPWFSRVLLWVPTANEDCSWVPLGDLFTVHFPPVCIQSIHLSLSTYKESHMKLKHTQILDHPIT